MIKIRGGNERNMGRAKTFLLLGMVCILLTGCSNAFAKEEYNDTDKIIATEDKFAKEYSVFNPIDNGYSLVVEKFDGRETLWTKTIEENKEIQVEIRLSMSAGTAKIVHIDEDGNITTLIEYTSESSKEENVVKTVSLKEGINRIKIVGYECKDIDLELLSSDFE